MLTYVDINHPPLTPLPAEIVSQSARPLDVMLSKAKHLVFSRCHEDEILRLRLRMTLRHSLAREGRLLGFPLPCGRWLAHIIHRQRKNDDTVSIERRDERAKSKAQSAKSSQRMFLKGSLLPAPCPMRKRTDPLPRSGGLASRSLSHVNNAS
jgi:hypothetical protein